MVTVLLIKPERDAVLIDLANGEPETIQRLLGGTYAITHIRASGMSVAHTTGTEKLHFNRQIDKKLYFGTILIAGRNKKDCLETLQSNDILKLVGIVPQAPMYMMPKTQSSDVDERVRRLKEQNEFVYYGKKKRYK